jgi:hypothetical protein
MNEDKVNNFLNAFSDRGRSCHDCNCGKTYYREDDTGYFEEGELERLEENPNAISLPHSVGVIHLGKKYYVEDCDCWEKERDRIIRFLDSHNFAVARYLTLEKERKKKEAELSPVVEES